MFLSADSHLHSLNLLYPRTLKCWNNTGMMIQKAAVEEKPGWMVSSGKSGTVHVHSSKHMFRFLDGGPSIHQFLQDGENVIRHLMQLSDLDNLLSVGTICYQLGESYLNVFFLRKMDNLLSVYKFYQNWIILLSDIMSEWQFFYLKVHGFRYRVFFFSLVPP